MKMRLGTLRRILREVDAAGGRWPGKGIKNALSPGINSREQLGSLSAKALDTVEDVDGMPDHLKEPDVTPEECFGPVPPDTEPPYVGQDPFVRDAFPTPTGALKR